MAIRELPRTKYSDVFLLMTSPLRTNDRSDRYQFDERLPRSLHRNRILSPPQACRCDTTEASGVKGQLWVQIPFADDRGVVRLPKGSALGSSESFQKSAVEGRLSPGHPRWSLPTSYVDKCSPTLVAVRTAANATANAAGTSVPLMRPSGSAGAQFL